MARIDIVKSTGEIESYDERKLRKSLQRAGASADVVKRILAQVRERLTPGMSTRKIYGLAFRLLRTEARPLAGRYGLRRAVTSLGPGGFSFEKFVAAILTADGYETTTNMMLAGRCVKHEVDVLAERGNRRLGVECKYHGQPNRKPDLKVALYVHARALDLKASGAVTDFWLVTNTSFTTEAAQYSACAGLTLRGLDDPPGESLRDIIERERLYPVTCLTSLKTRQVRALLDRDVVLSQDLLSEPEHLTALGLRDEAADRVLDEVRELPRLIEKRKKASKRKAKSRSRGRG